MPSPHKPVSKYLGGCPGQWGEMFMGLKNVISHFARETKGTLMGVFLTAARRHRAQQNPLRRIRVFLIGYVTRITWTSHQGGMRASCFSTLSPCGPQAV